MNLDKIPSPAYVCEMEKLEKNLAIFDRVQQATGAKILCALKGYSLWSTFECIGKTLHGCAASGLWEAKLGRDTMNKEVHTYSPAFRDDEIDEIIRVSDHIIFNSFSQWNHFKSFVFSHEKKVECGLRVNFGYSEIEVALYNPCSPFSRLGIPMSEFLKDNLEGISGLHFHTHCEQNADALERGLAIFEEKFGDVIPRMKWINFGGGHHITRADYDVDLLIKIIQDFRQRYNNIDVYLEPGEAVGWQTGVLVAQVIDIVHNGMDIAILDVSAEAHMPDTLAMPYRAMVRNSGEPHEKAFTYRLGGPTCLAGDIIGDYSFDNPLVIGDKLIFEDQIHYTMVKTTMFNGVRHPDIGLWTNEGEYHLIRRFSYEDFKGRLS